MDPVLGALADNGGATETHGLLAGSPARDAGQCASGVDQRGFPRPIDLSEPNVANGCDIGAFEVQVAHVAPTTVHVVEGGDTESYTVTLLAEPRASVTITIVPDDQTTVSPQVLTFTSATWNQPQSVTVSAVDDGIYEGAHTGTITHTASSADPRFQGDVVPDVLAIIADRANHLYLPVIAK